jgi:hypothetical protein
MGYKILGYAVWNGVKWYLQGQVPGTSRKIPSRRATVAGLGAALVVGGAVFAQRRLATG